MIYTFSGRYLSGKDHVAQLIGCTILGFADPIYKIVELMTRSFDKELPGIRKIMQQVGQWGRGVITDDQPYSIERALFQKWIKDTSIYIPGLPSSINLQATYGFGSNEDIWIDILLDRLQRHISFYPNKKIAITNMRFLNEFIKFNELGAKHFHVMTSRETRNERGLVTLDLDTDITEELAIFLDEIAINGLFRSNNIPHGMFCQAIPSVLISPVKDRSGIIWNDDRPAPWGTSAVAFTLDRFKKEHG